eukprot:11192477-Alexandrium_andersonii.AAC.1
MHLVALLRPRLAALLGLRLPVPHYVMRLAKAFPCRQRGHVKDTRRTASLFWPADLDCLALPDGELPALLPV